MSLDVHHTQIVGKAYTTSQQPYNGTPSPPPWAFHLQLISQQSLGTISSVVHSTQFNLGSRITLLSSTAAL